jgi:hypothetical protein
MQHKILLLLHEKVIVAIIKLCGIHGEHSNPPSFRISALYHGICRFARENSTGLSAAAKEKEMPEGISFVLIP